MDMIALQNQFAQEVVQPISGAWDTVHVHYENASVEGTGREIYTAYFLAGGVKHEFDPSLDAIDVLAELQRHPPSGQKEKWTWLEFDMDNTGKYKFDYKYGVPPHTATAVKYSQPAG
jgi:hypothetical protein